MEPTHPTLYHLIRESDWARAQEQPEYRSVSLATEGFIHCSTRAQVAGSANRHFAGMGPLKILHIDAEKVTAEIRYEGKGSYPHIYGPLNRDAVVGETLLVPSDDGVYPEL